MARILVAEPDQRIRDFVSGILADCGHAVEAYADGVEAIAALGAGSIDVIVTDLVLSRGEGAVFTRSCAGLGIPMITLSGCEFHPGQRVTGRPSSLLEKPFRFADLRCVLHAVAFRSRSARRDGPMTQPVTRDAA
ncbi:MAG: response regulator transcription factor [Stellaceae bacterium]